MRLLKTPCIKTGSLCLFLLAGCAGHLRDKQKKAEIYYSQGTKDLIDKNYTSALKHLRKAKALSPGESRIHNNLGMAYYFKGRPHKALKYLERAVELDDKNSDARNNLAGLYLQRGRLDQAEHQYQQVLDDLVYEHHYRTHYNLALLDMRRGRLSAAVAHLNDSLKDRGGYCPALYQLGIVAKSKDNYLQAEEHFKNGIKGTCYQLPAPHFQLALIWTKLGEYEKAKAKLEKIVEKFPNSEYDSLASQQLKKLKETVGRKGSVHSEKMAPQNPVPPPLAF